MRCDWLVCGVLRALPARGFIPVLCLQGSAEAGLRTAKRSMDVYIRAGNAMREIMP